MHSLKVEFRELRSSMSLSKDLATLIAERSVCGKIVVVVENPKSNYGPVRKQWHRLIRLLEKDRARTLNALQISKIENEISRLSQLSFSYEYTDFELSADVTFASADQLVEMPPVCQTIIVTYDFERSKLHLLTSWVPIHGLVVIYENE